MGALMGHPKQLADITQRQTGGDQLPCGCADLAGGLGLGPCGLLAQRLGAIQVDLYLGGQGGADLERHRARLHPRHHDHEVSRHGIYLTQMPGLSYPDPLYTDQPEPAVSLDGHLVGRHERHLGRPIGYLLAHQERDLSAALIAAFDLEI